MSNEVWTTEDPKEALKQLKSVIESFLNDDVIKFRDNSSRAIPYATWSDEESPVVSRNIINFSDYCAEGIKLLNNVELYLKAALYSYNKAEKNGEIELIKLRK